MRRFDLLRSCGVLAAGLALVGCPEPPPPCATHDDCGELQFCADETFCLDVFDRTYDITMVEATVPATGTTGGPWDPEDSSDPDMIAVFGIPAVFDENDEIVEPEEAVQTSVLDDTTNPMWNEGGEVTFRQGRAFTINLFDFEGDGTATFMGGWIWETDEALVQLVRQLGEDQIVGSGSFSTTFRIDPPR
ncbi:MAG: hypothetical protein EP330_12375 [Deltaproteobacteria bacterium]|nr:MAG: hypothetical protein EP330_12375 [Deltaproteobacteria bacterium]